MSLLNVAPFCEHMERSMQKTDETETSPRTLASMALRRLLVLSKNNNQKFRKPAGAVGFFNCLLHFARLTNVKRLKPTTNHSITMTYTETTSPAASRSLQNNSRLMGGQFPVKISFQTLKLQLYKTSLATRRFLFRDSGNVSPPSSGRSSRLPVSECLLPGFHSHSTACGAT
jgi:hypothetical protein